MHEITWASVGANESAPTRQPMFHWRFYFMYVPKCCENGTETARPWPSNKSVWTIRTEPFAIFKLTCFEGIVVITKFSTKLYKQEQMKALATIVPVLPNVVKLI